jgi:hypothetical protein
MAMETKPVFTYTEYVMWDMVIEACSQASLMVSSDKLIALSGVAKRFKSC